MKYRDVSKLIELDGWYWKRTKGSHKIYWHRTKPGSVTIAGIPEKTCRKELGRVSSDKLDWSKSMRDYLVIYERAADGGWGAYAPDLPGLGVGGETFEETQTLIREGIAIHIESLLEQGQPVPEPTTIAARVEVEIAA